MATNETTEVSLQSILDTIGSMKQSLQKSFDNVNARVDDLMTQSRSRSRTPSPRRKEPERSHKSREPECSHDRRSRGKEPERSSLPWALQSDTVSDLPPITDRDFCDSDEELTPREEGVKLSEETEYVLSQLITATLENNTRREICGRYPVPETDMTRTPKLDEIFTSSESKFQKNAEAKSVEKDLLHVTACTLDVARPLIDIIEGVNSGWLSPADAKDRAIDALTLLGNTIAHTSQIRRKWVLKVCNPDITSLAENKDLFTKAPPMLFGKGFENKMQDRAEALKVLHKGQATSSGHQSSRKPYFRGNRPSIPQRGGGYGYRGRTHQGNQNRFAPYRQSHYQFKGTKKDL